MPRYHPKYELAQRESGLWVILHRIGREASAVETGHVDRSLAELDLESFASSGTLSPISRGWMAVAQRLAENVKTNRNRRGVEGPPVVLTREDILALLCKQNYACAVTGSYFTHDAFETERRSPFQPSVDRIDPSLGYLHDNVRIVCLLVNMAMSDWGYEPLRKIAHRIVAREIRPVGRPTDSPARSSLRLLSCEIKDVETPNESDHEVCTTLL